MNMKMSNAAISFSFIIAAAVSEGNKSVYGKYCSASASCLVMRLTWVEGHLLPIVRSRQVLLVAVFFLKCLLRVFFNML